jgi:antitoxin MazE
MIVSKVQRWGNSQGLRLSKQLLDQADINVGDEVEIVVGEQQILVKKAAKRKPKYDIRDLVTQIPKGYKAKEAPFGPAVGKEEW